MNKVKKKVKRPTSITIICVLGFIGAVVTIPLIFSSTAQQIGSWYPPYLAISGIIGGICMVGLWLMKKWAAYIYTAFVVLNQLVLIEVGIWNIFALILPGIVVFFALFHVSKMS